MRLTKESGLPVIAGLSGLYLFSFSLWLSTAGAHIGLVLMLLAALADRNARTMLRRDAMVRLTLMFAGFLLIYALSAAWTGAEEPGELWGEAWKWLRVFVFLILVAWWLAGDEAVIGRALLLVLTGLLLRIMLGVQATGISILWSGERSGFGLPVNSFGLYCTTALLGLLTLAARMWRAPEQPNYLTAVRVLAWCLAILIVSQGLITSQSRDAWIASLIIIPLALVLRLAVSIRNAGGIHWLRAAAALLLIATLIGAVTARNLDTITQRIEIQQDSWRSLLAGDFDSIPSESIGKRIQLFEYGVRKWLERPVIGWGPYSYRDLIAQTENSDLHRMAHLHNAYIETLLTLGILGAAFFLYLLVRLCSVIYHSWRASRLSADLALFLAGALGLQLIWCLASFGFQQVTWSFYFAMLAGSIYSYRIRARGETTMRSLSI